MAVYFLQKPEFIISTGDNFYCCGVASTNDPQWNKSFEDIYTGNALQIDWYVVLGNHDYRGDPEAEIAYSKVSRRWNMPARYYTVVKKTEDGKKIRLVFIDSNPFLKKYHKDKADYADLDLQDTTRQKVWLDSVLSVSKEDYKFVFGHHPVYSSGKKQNSIPEMESALKPIFEKHKITAYISGHDHNMQHQQPAGGIDYFISGAGSEAEVKEHAASGKDYTKFFMATLGFAWVSIKGNMMKFYFIDKNCNVVYSYQRKID